MKQMQIAVVVVVVVAVAVVAVVAMALNVNAQEIPFGSHLHNYTAGTILPTGGGSQEEMDAAVIAFYETWKGLYLRSGCDGYYVQYQEDAEQLTVSEAHGYGMLVTVIMAGADEDAHAIFDGLLVYYLNHRSSIDGRLMAWKQRDCEDVEGVNSATDGDLDVALALIMGERQWPGFGYASVAQDVMEGIMDSDTDSTKTIMLLGDWAPNSNEAKYRTSTRPSDFMLHHYRSFARFHPEYTDIWNNIYDYTLSIVETIQQRHSSSGLMPDFVVDALSANDISPAPPNFLESANDGNYYYNSCRSPWRLATDYLMPEGSEETRVLLRKMNSFIQSTSQSNPANIRAGYTLAGTPLSGSSYTTMAFIAPFGVSAMVDETNQAWLNSLYNFIVAYPSEAYYEDSIKLFSLIIMSNNWWAI